MTDTIESLKARIRLLENEITRLQDQEQQLELVLQSTGVGIWDWYVQSGETTFNERWANIIGYSLEELQPLSIETWTRFAHPEDLKESDRLLKAHWRGETEYYLFESRMRHKDGHWIWVYDTGKVIEWESEGVPKRMIGTHLDITEQKRNMAKLDEANRELRELGYVDPLTGIPNRRSYDEHMKDAIAIAKRNGSSLAVLMIDIDHFKKYNDQFGHELGDQALVRVAKAIDHSLKREVDFAARYGGEEFVVILPGTDLSGTETVAKRILQNVIDEEIRHPSSPFDGVLTVSVGIAVAKGQLDHLLNQADKALYKAKSSGRNRYEVFNHSLMNEQ